MKKLKPVYKAPKRRLQPPLIHTFDQVMGALYQNGGYVELYTQRGAWFWARPGVLPTGRRYIQVREWEKIYEDNWGYNRNEPGKVYIGSYSRALDNWALKYW
jgi:hypothetical protein